MITAASGREEAGELDISLSCQRGQLDRGIFGRLVSGEMQKPTLEGGLVVRGEGLEPSFSGPKPDVLPLDDPRRTGFYVISDIP